MNNRKTKRFLSLTGFTFLELMVVCGIVIVALAGLLATYVVCFDLMEITKNSNLAMQAIQQVVEEARSIGFPSIYSTYNGYSVQIPSMTPNASRVYISVNNTNASLLEVNAGACWEQKSGKIIGECYNASGVIIFNDTNGNGVLDSPVQITTLMGQR